MPRRESREEREYSSIESLQKEFLPNMSKAGLLDFEVGEDVEKQQGTGLAVDLVKALRKELRPLLS